MRVIERERVDKTQTARWKNNFHDKMGKLLLIFASIFAQDILFPCIFQFFKKLVSVSSYEWICGERMCAACKRLNILFECVCVSACVHRR